MNDVPANAHDEWDELAAGYALHALEPDEELRFTRHLRDCVTCRQLLGEHELVAAQLASLAHDEDTVPPSWGSIRAGVLDEPEDQSDAVVPIDRARQRRRQPRVLAAAAALVLVAGAGVVVWAARGSSPSSPGVQAVKTCRTQHGCSVVRLHTPDGAAPGIVLVSAERATMVPTAMAPAPPGKTYVLWQLLRNGGPTAVATFRDARRQESAPLVMPYADTAAFAVSIEPAGLPPSQPTHVVAVGNTSA